ncbi:MAG: peptidoglycan DD-metalloendopeptidase family protein, partial [Candidatus Omnitrophica bacterium]|nr:peptidoglycan DD-metalloendopeptidase family protein [Candidatus Omnitrophota bacterium]
MEFFEIPLVYSNGIYIIGKRDEEGVIVTYRRTRYNRQTFFTIPGSSKDDLTIFNLGAYVRDVFEEERQRILVGRSLLITQVVEEQLSQPLEALADDLGKIDYAAFDDEGIGRRVNAHIKAMRSAIVSSLSQCEEVSARIAGNGTDTKQSMDRLMLELTKKIAKELKELDTVMSLIPLVPEVVAARDSFETLQGARMDNVDFVVQQDQIRDILADWSDNRIIPHYSGNGHDGSLMTKQMLVRAAAQGSGIVLVQREDSIAYMKVPVCGAMGKNRRRKFFVFITSNSARRADGVGQNGYRNNGSQRKGRASSRRSVNDFSDVALKRLIMDAQAGKKEAWEKIRRRLFPFVGWIVDKQILTRFPQLRCYREDLVLVGLAHLAKDRHGPNPIGVTGGLYSAVMNCNLSNIPERKIISFLATCIRNAVLRLVKKLTEDQERVPASLDEPRGPSGSTLTLGNIITHSDTTVCELLPSEATMDLAKIWRTLDALTQEGVVSGRDASMFRLYYSPEEDLSLEDIGKMFDGLTRETVRLRRDIVEGKVCERLESQVSSPVLQTPSRTNRRHLPRKNGRRLGVGVSSPAQRPDFPIEKRLRRLPSFWKELRGVVNPPALPEAPSIFSEEFFTSAVAIVDRNDWSQADKEDFLLVLCHQYYPPFPAAAAFGRALFFLQWALRGEREFYSSERKHRIRLARWLRKIEALRGSIPYGRHPQPEFFEALVHPLSLSRQILEEAHGKYIESEKRHGMLSRSGVLRLDDITDQYLLYVPHYRMATCLEEYLNILNRELLLIEQNDENRLDPLYLAVWAFYSLAWIHPFELGNARFSVKMMERVLYRSNYPLVVFTSWHDILFYYYFGGDNAEYIATYYYAPTYARRALDFDAPHVGWLGDLGQIPALEDCRASLDFIPRLDGRAPLSSSSPAGGSAIPFVQLNGLKIRDKNGEQYEVKVVDVERLICITVELLQGEVGEDWFWRTLGGESFGNSPFLTARTVSCLTFLRGTLTNVVSLLQGETLPLFQRRGIFGAVIRALHKIMPQDVQIEIVLDLERVLYGRPSALQQAFAKRGFQTVPTSTGITILCKEPAAIASSPIITRSDSQKERQVTPVDRIRSVTETPVSAWLMWLMRRGERPRRRVKPKQLPQQEEDSVEISPEAERLLDEEEEEKSSSPAQRDGENRNGPIFLGFKLDLAVSDYETALAEIAGKKSRKGEGAAEEHRYEDKLALFFAYYRFMRGIACCLGDEGTFLYPFRGIDIVPSMLVRTVSLNEDNGDFDDGREMAGAVLGSTHPLVRQSEEAGRLEIGRDATTLRAYDDAVRDVQRPLTLIAKGLYGYLELSLVWKNHALPPDLILRHITDEILCCGDRILVLDAYDWDSLEATGLLEGFSTHYAQTQMRVDSSVSLFTLRNRLFLLPTAVVLLVKEQGCFSHASSPARAAFDYGVLDQEYVEYCNNQGPGGQDEFDLRKLEASFRRHHVGYPQKLELIFGRPRLAYLLYLYDRYASHIRNARTFNFNSAFCVHDSLLVTGAAQTVMFSMQPFSSKEERNSHIRLTFADILRFRVPYFNSPLDSAAMEVSLLMDLRLLGVPADSIKVRQLKRGTDIWEISFLWQHPREKAARQRSIIYIGSTKLCDLPGIDPGIFESGFNFILEKAPDYESDSEGLEEIKRNLFVVGTFVQNHLRPNGYALVEKQPFRKDGYKDIGDLWRQRFLPRLALVRTPSEIIGVEWGYSEIAVWRLSSPGSKTDEYDNELVLALAGVGNWRLRTLPGDQEIPGGGVFVDRPRIRSGASPMQAKNRTVPISVPAAKGSASSPVETNNERGRHCFITEIKDKLPLPISREDMPRDFVRWEFPYGTEYLDRRNWSTSKFRTIWMTVFCGPFCFDRSQPHGGVDFAFYKTRKGKKRHIAAGVPVRSVDEGRIIYITPEHLAGSFRQGVVVYHQHFNLQSMYTHIEPALGLVSGQEVEQGQPLGAIVRTEWPLLSHLHFSVKANSEDIFSYPQHPYLEYAYPWSFICYHEVCSLNQPASSSSVPGHIPTDNGTSPHTILKMIETQMDSALPGAIRIYTYLQELILLRTVGIITEETRWFNLLPGADLFSGLYGGAGMWTCDRFNDELSVRWNFRMAYDLVAQVYPEILPSIDSLCPIIVHEMRDILQDGLIDSWVHAMKYGDILFLKQVDYNLRFYGQSEERVRRWFENLIVQIPAGVYVVAFVYRTSLTEFLFGRQGGLIEYLKSAGMFQEPLSILLSPAERARLCALNTDERLVTYQPDIHGIELTERCFFDGGGEFAVFQRVSASSPVQTTHYRNVSAENGLQNERVSPRGTSPRDDEEAYQRAMRNREAQAWEVLFRELQGSPTVLIDGQRVVQIRSNYTPLFNSNSSLSPAIKARISQLRLRVCRYLAEEWGMGQLCDTAVDNMIGDFAFEEEDLILRTLFLLLADTSRYPLQDFIADREDFIASLSLDIAQLWEGMMLIYSTPEEIVELLTRNFLDNKDFLHSKAHQKLCECIQEVVQPLSSSSKDSLSPEDLSTMLFKKFGSIYWIKHHTQPLCRIEELLARKDEVLTHLAEAGWLEIEVLAGAGVDVEIPKVFLRRRVVDTIISMLQANKQPEMDTLKTTLEISPDSMREINVSHEELSGWIKEGTARFLGVAVPQAAEKLRSMPIHPTIGAVSRHLGFRADYLRECVYLKVISYAQLRSWGVVYLGGRRSVDVDALMKRLRKIIARLTQTAERNHTNANLSLASLSVRLKRDQGYLKHLVFRQGTLCAREIEDLQGISSIAASVSRERITFDDPESLRSLLPLLKAPHQYILSLRKNLGLRQIDAARLVGCSHDVLRRNESYVENRWMPPTLLIMRRLGADPQLCQVIEELPGRIRALRRQKGWTIPELAAVSGVSKSVIDKLEYERGNCSWAN